MRGVVVVVKPVHIGRFQPIDVCFEESEYWDAGEFRLSSEELGD